MINVFTYGDSHASKRFPWGKVDIEDVDIETGKFRPGKLMFSFGRDQDIVVNKDIPDESILIFAYGETDCRMHVHKHCEEEGGWEENIQNNVKCYFENIERNITFLTPKIVHVMVYNIVPTWEPLHDYAVGTAKDILKYTKFMNIELEKKCEEYGYTFLNVYDKYADERGYLKEEYSDKIVHIIDPIHIESFLINYIDEHMGK